MKFNSILLNRGIFAFFIFGSLFTTLRLLLIGSKQSASIGEYFISILPEILVLFIISYFIFFIKKSIHSLSINYVDLIVIGFILSNLILGFYIANNVELSLYGVRTTYLPMAFYFIGSLSMQNNKELMKLVDQIFNWFFIVSLIGIILYFGFYDTMVKMLLIAGPVLQKHFIVRMTSIFWTPVLFGVTMTSTYLYFTFKKTLEKTLMNDFIRFILLASIILSVTRGAIYTTLIGLVLLLTISKKWKILISTTSFYFILILILSYYIITPELFKNWILNSATETIQLKSEVTRVGLWNKAYADFTQHPFGQGLGKAGHVAARFFDSESTQASTTSTDGWFLKLACETGIWGLFSYLILAGTLFIVSVKHIYRGGSKFFNFLFTFFIIVNIQCIFSNVLDFYLFSYLYWFLIGVMVLQIKSKTIVNGAS